MTIPPRLLPDAAQAAVIAALHAPAAFGEDRSPVEVIETHISYVFLAGDCAYKVKKAIRLPFLDFSTLEARRRCCEIEVTLNRRTAPSIYLGVVPIVACEGGFAVGGDGEPVEWAIRMRRFPQEALLSSMLARGSLAPGDVDALAVRVAAFHDSLEGASPGQRHGSPAHALSLALDNLSELDALVREPAGRERIAALQAWTRGEHAHRASLMERRHAAGFVRECHGDLHLANVAMIDGEPTPFDCIEFSEAMRWSDVMSDVAFTTMDFRALGRADLARRYVNGYLEAGGDYGGAPLLPFYGVYRALVRAKVAMLRAAGAGDGTAAPAEALRYLDLATALTRPRPRTIVVMHGLAGCGKTSLSQALIESADIVRLRMDVERKRQHGLRANERRASGVDEGLYAPQASRAAYESVAATAESLVRGGQAVVVDAAFLRRWQRDLFRDIARRSDAAFVIVDLPANEAELRSRVARRAAEGRDASDADVAVLEHQLATHEPLGADELEATVAFDANLPVRETVASARWREWAAGLEGGNGE